MKTDSFRFFTSPVAQPLTVEIPNQITTPREVSRILRDQLGLAMPSDMDTFWISSRRCILTRRLDGSPLGELLEVL